MKMIADYHNSAADLEGVTQWPVTIFFLAMILNIKPTDYIKSTKYRQCR